MNICHETSGSHFALHGPDETNQLVAMPRSGRFPAGVTQDAFRHVSTVENSRRITTSVNGLIDY